MENLTQCKLVVYSDASYNNIENGGSQGGFAYFYRILMEIYTQLCGSLIRSVEWLKAQWLQKL